MTKVLVVDDSRTVHTFVKSALEERDVEIKDAFNGKEALEIYKEFKPDLVFLDIVMPELDGISTLKELKKIDSEARVVMASSMGTKEKVVEALQIGAIDFLQKPFQNDDLLEHFDKLGA